MRGRLLRLGALVSVGAVVAAVIASSAFAALFFLFKPTAAKPGDQVTIRTAPYTPASFTLRQREKPFQKPFRLYLVPNKVAREVRSRFDPRLHFIGSLVPDRLARGLLTFSVPPLDTDDYALAAWSPRRDRYSPRGAFFVWPVGQGTAYRFGPMMLLRIEMPPATASCPVTHGTGPAERYGNGLLSTRVASNGVLHARREPDGTLFQKLGWLPNGFTGTLTVRGERLDAASPPMRVLGVFWGYASSGPGARGSWASAVTFPSEGCWRISGRVRDIRLTYVVAVVGT